MVSRDLLDKLALSLLLASLLCMMAGDAFCQTSVDVYPKVTLRDPHKLTAFRVRLRIEPNPDNREYAYFATCGAEQISSIRKIDFVTKTFFENLTVLDQCLFQLCVSRLGEKTARCVKTEVFVPDPGG